MDECDSAHASRAYNLVERMGIHNLLEYRIDGNKHRRGGANNGFLVHECKVM